MQNVQIDVPYLLVLAISAGLWVLGLLAKIVFDAALRATEPREAVSRLLAALAHRDAFQWDGPFLRSGPLAVRVYISGDPDIVLNGRDNIVNAFTNRERKRICAACRKLHEYHTAIATKQALDEAGL